MLKFSVLLLYPDYLASNYGEETYLAHVQATTPAEAIKAAQAEASTFPNEEVDPDDFLCLACFHGHLDDVKDG